MMIRRRCKARGGGGGGQQRCILRKKMRRWRLRTAAAAAGLLHGFDAEVWRKSARAGHVCVHVVIHTRVVEERV